MRTPSLLLTAALAISSGCTTDDQPEQTPISATAKAERTERALQGNKGGVSQPAVEKVDPCAALIKDESLKNFYDKWREHFDLLMKQVDPAPQALHDPNAQMCEMAAPNVNVIFARDGQFAGHEMKLNKPNLSYRVALEIGNTPLDKNTNPSPPHNFSSPPYCQSLVLDRWKQWDLMMPGENGPTETHQFHVDSLDIPCDPTETVYVGGGGCWHEEPSPENENQRIDGCGGGASPIDRNEALALMECVHKAIQGKGTEMCL